MTKEEQTTSTAHAFWEDFYRDTERWAPGRVNPVMATIVETLTPGRALDLGCGEGGDAMWLAMRGWDVTAVDVSTIAMTRAAERADAAGVGTRITWEQHDLEQTFPAGGFDLVSAQFLQSPVEFARERVLRAAAGAVAPGGTLLVVAHAAFPPWHEHPDPDTHFPTPDEELATLALPPAQWRVDRAEVLERQGTAPDGTAGVLFDSVVAVTRLTEQES